MPQKMNKSKKKRNKKNSSHSEELNIHIKKVSPVSVIGKKNKKKQKKLSRALNNAVLMSQPTISTSQEHHPKTKKKKKKLHHSPERPSENHNNIPLQEFFDTVANINDFGTSSTVTDIKSFFTPQMLIPEECVIQYVKMPVRPKLFVNNNLSVENEDAHTVAKQTHYQVAVDQTHGDQHHGDSNLDTDSDADLDIDADADIDIDADGAVDADLDDDAVADVNGDAEAGTEELDMGINVDDDNHMNMEDTDMEENNLQYHRLPKNKCLVEMKYKKNMFIRGQLNIRVLFGSVEILGWCVNVTNDKSVSLFSPRGYSLLCLEPHEHSSKKLDEVENKLTALGLDSSLAAEVVRGLDEQTSLVLFERSESTLYSFLGLHYPSLSLYSRSIDKASGKFHEMESILKCHLQSSIFFGHCYEKSQNWEELAEEVEEDFIKKGRSRLVVCGGQGVGKSTLLRFLANRSLQAHGEVLFLDFDPGQSEFTVPGCVSVVRVTEPLLGPNYTHIRTPERSVYLGHINVDNCPDRYIQGVQYIMDYCQSVPELNKMVWLVNTMGYPKDLGMELNMTIIGVVQPTRVVQIVSKSARRNFPVPLLPENVLEGRGRWCLPPATLDFKLFQLQSLAETHGDQSWGLQPKILRDFLMLAYFHKILEKQQKFLSDVIPHRTSLSGLTLGVLHETVQPADVLGAMNAALVALCEIGANADVLVPDDDTLPHVLTKPPVCPCLGFGVVRGVDVESRTVYITTPLHPSRLQAVDCMTTGAVMLPPTLLLNPKAGPGRVPYLTKGPGQVTSRPVAQKYVVPGSKKSRKN